MKNLKARICNELLNELETTTLDKIKVSRICSKVGVSRQSFYYHFKDPFDAFEYIIKDATKGPLEEYCNISNWVLSVSLVIKWFKNHEHIVQNSEKALGSDYLLNLMRKIICPYLYQIIKDESKKYDVTEYQICFITDFIAISIVSVFQEWLKKYTREPIDVVIAHTEAMLKGDIVKGLQNMSELNKKNNLKEIEN